MMVTTTIGITREHSPLGEGSLDHCSAGGLQFNQTVCDQKRKISCFLYEVRLLDQNL